MMDEDRRPALRARLRRCPGLLAIAMEDGSFLMHDQAGNVLGIAFPWLSSYAGRKLDDRWGEIRSDFPLPSDSLTTASRPYHQQGGRPVSPETIAAICRLVVERPEDSIRDLALLLRERTGIGAHYNTIERYRYTLESILNVAIDRRTARADEGSEASRIKYLISRGKLRRGRRAKWLENRDMLAAASGVSDAKTLVSSWVDAGMPMADGGAGNPGDGDDLLSALDPRARRLFRQVVADGASCQEAGAAETPPIGKERVREIINQSFAILKSQANDGATP